MYVFLWLIDIVLWLLDLCMYENGVSSGWVGIVTAIAAGIFVGLTGVDLDIF